MYFYEQSHLVQLNKKYVKMMKNVKEEEEVDEEVKE